MTKCQCHRTIDWKTTRIRFLHTGSNNGKVLLYCTKCKSVHIANWSDIKRNFPPAEIPNAKNS